MSRPRVPPSSPLRTWDPNSSSDSSTIDETLFPDNLETTISPADTPGSTVPPLTPSLSLSSSLSADCFTPKNTEKLAMTPQPRGRPGSSTEENLSSLDETSSFLDITVPPPEFAVENPDGKFEKSSESQPDATVDQENIREYSGGNSGRNGVSAKTPVRSIGTSKRIEIIDLTSPTRSPLLSTQPPAAAGRPSAKPRPSTRTAAHRTLDTWLNWYRTPAKPKPANAEKYAFRSGVTVSGPPEKTPAEADLRNRHGTLSGKTTQFRTASISRDMQISPRKSIKRQDVGMTKTQDFAVVVPSTSNTHDDVTLSPISPSAAPDVNPSVAIREPPVLPRSTLDEFRQTKKPVKQEVTLENALCQSSITTVYPAKSAHIRSLINVISSPTFCRNDNRYAEMMLSSRFDEDGKIRRKKEDRNVLHGYDCRCCTAYYDALGLDDVKRRERIDQVSKHRDVAPGPSTPERYWDVGMPSREEQRRRGQIVESNSQIPIKTRYPQYSRNKTARRKLFT